MKKYSHILIAVVVLLGITLYSCEKDQVQQSTTDENIVLYEDLSMLNDVSSNSYNNHIYRVEILGNNNELENLINDISGQDIPIESLNIYGIKKHQLNNSEIVMYSIPFNNSEDKIIVYKYDNLYQVSIAEYISHTDGPSRFNIKTLDGELYYGLDLNEENQIVDITLGENRQIDKFNKDIYTLNLSKYGNTEQEVSTTKATCCRQEADWSSCMDCTTSWLGSSRIGRAALSIFGSELYVVIGISCLNAGSSAVC